MHTANVSISLQNNTGRMYVRDDGNAELAYAELAYVFMHLHRGINRGIEG